MHSTWFIVEKIIWCHYKQLFVKQVHIKLQIKNNYHFAPKIHVPLFIHFNHYVGMWFKFDDDRVSQVTSEDILRLSGGGDWHCAYILLYGPHFIEKNACVDPSGSTVWSS